MHPLFNDYLDRLTTLHNDMVAVLDRLPQAALDWKPGANMNSIAVLVAHTAGAERYWIGDVTVRGTTQRVREREFETSGLDHATLKRLLEEATADARASLAALSIEALGEERTDMRNAESYTLGWCLLHALEHTATHVGHVQLMGDMWEQLQKGEPA